MNKIILIGRNTKDIELRYTPSNVAAAQFSLAVQRNFKNKEGNYDTDFINCVAYRNLAETIAKYIRKGDKLGVEGKLQNRSYDAQDGTKRYVSEVIVENIEFLEAKKQENASNEKITSTDASNDLDIPQNYKTNYEETEIKLSDDDLPF